MTTVEQSNSLPQLAAEASRCHVVIAQAQQNAEKIKCESGIKAGNALHEARALIKATGGKWLDWLAKNCPNIPKRSAQLYMRVAKNATGVAHLSLRKADKTLAQSKGDKSNQPSGDIVQFPTMPKATPQRKPNKGAGKASKGRMKAKRKQANSAPPRRNFFAHVPLFFEEMLIALERCATEYDLPDLDKTARAAIQQRLAVKHFDEIITYLTQLKEKVHGADSGEESHGTQAD